MKLIDALLNVDKTQAEWVDTESLCQALGIPYDWDGSKHNDQLKCYYVIKWYCTDQWVGLSAVYLDDELVACSMQTARRCDKEWGFVSVEMANKLREFLSPDVAASPLIDPDQEIAEFYSVEFTGQLLAKEGLYEGKPVTVVSTKERWITDQQVILSDGLKQFTGDVRKLKIPLECHMPMKHACDRKLVKMKNS